MSLDHSLLLSLVHYDPESGLFTYACRYRKKEPGTPLKGSTDKRGRLVLCVAGKRYLAHRLAWFYVRGYWPENYVDHRNGKHENNFDNLREATNKQNGQNRGIQKNNRSGYKGVYPYGYSWQAVIKIDGKAKRLGVFGTKEEASDAYEKAAKAYFGEFYRPRQA